MIDVLLVDEQRLFCDAMKALIDHEDDFNVVGQAENGQEALEKITELKPDVVIMDIDLPIINGIEVAYTIQSDHPNTNVILMTQNLVEERIAKGMMAGANGFLIKDSSPENLYNTIRLVYDGHTIISDPITKELKNYVSGLITDRREIIADILERHDISLTEREIEVADLFRLGLNNHQIADRLDLKVGTVKNYISNIYTALNMNKRKDAMNFLHEALKYINDN